MDADTTLGVIADWIALHKDQCLVSELDVSITLTVAAVTRIRLECPTCAGSISGVVEDVDVPLVRQLLDPTRVNW